MRHDTLVVDIGELVDGIPWTRLQTGVFLSVFVALFSDGIANQVLSISIPALMKDWHLPRSMFAAVTATGIAGLIIGAMTGGFIADRIGRKPVLLASLTLFASATLLIAFTNGIGTFAALRFIDGLGIGSTIPVGSSLISEFSPARLRSRVVTWSLLSIPIGSFVCGLVGGAVLPAFGWRAMFVMTSGLGFLAAVRLLFTPESPRFLASASDKQDSLLRLLNRMNRPVDRDAIIVDKERGAAGGRNSIMALFDKQLRWSSCLLFAGFFFSFVAVYSLIGWLPSLLSSRGYSLSVSSYALSIYSGGAIIGSFTWAYLCELYGSRRALLITGLSAFFYSVFLSQFPMNSAHSALPVLIAIGILGIILNSFSASVYPLTAHTYPPGIRATAMGSAMAVGRLGAIVSPFIAAATITIGGGIYFLMIAAAILSAMLLFVAMPKPVPARLSLKRSG